jgi:hypothetical protein
MEFMFTMFLLFFAALTSLLTYLFIPRLPVVALASGAAVVLTAVVWWHWTQFSEEYRLSTWQEGLRNYASYALVLLVILLSYGFYAFAWNGEVVQSYIQSARNSVRNAGRKATTQLSRSISSTSNAFLGETIPMNVENVPAM